MPGLSSHKGIIYGLLAISYLATYFLGYHLERTSSLLIPLFSILFAAYWWLLSLKLDQQELRIIVIAAIGLRLLLIMSFPQLSDDIYRFVWDGRLLNAGINPFAELPSFYLQEGKHVPGLDQSLFSELNSKEYFTIYPPFAQFVFWLSTALSNSIIGAAVIIRGLIILAEIGSIFILQRLLEYYNIPKQNVLLYALNPLVIIELTGNLHFEAFMIFFLLIGIYCLISNSIVKSAFFMATSIASKLIPLILLPVFLKRITPKILIKWYLFIALFVVVFFIPLISEELIVGMSSSIGLYFLKFEFNASVYYLIREIGYWHYDYNIIASVGKYLALATFIGILLLSIVRLKSQNQLVLMILALTFYFLLATTVHPWYITTIVALSVITSFRYSILWSFLIFLTYLGYTEDGFGENFVVLFLEYVIVISFMFYEIYKYIIKSRDTVTT